MMRSYERALGGLKLAGTLLAAMTMLAGCTTGMNSDAAGNLMNSGISETRSGIQKTQGGVDKVNAGSRSAGIGDIDDGLGMATHGVADMNSGMGQMSSGMMMNCVDGGHAAMMDQLQQAMDEMNVGHGMLQPDAGDQDTDAIGRLQTGISMMTAVLDEAQASMTCMGHGSGMMGMH